MNPCVKTVAGKMWISAVIMLLSLSFVSGEKILLLPFQWSSHVQEMLAMAGEITAAKGHETFTVLSESFPGLEELRERNPTTTILVFKAVKTDFFQFPPSNVEETFDSILKTPLKTNYKNPYVSLGFDAFCDNLLGDVDFLEEIRNIGIDLVIIDTMPNTECYYILPYKLGLRHMAYTAGYNPWLSRNPALPSFVPFMYTNVYDLTTSMTFYQRFANLWDMIDFNGLTRRYAADDTLVTKYAPEKPFTSISNLIRQNVIWLLASDVVLDFPAPRMPNEFYIGGHKLKPAKPLPSDLETFLEFYPNGVIIVTFGGLSNLPKKYFEKLLSAFKQIEYGVIWKCPLSSVAENDQIQSHIKLMDWIPQADLLADPRVKLFITHAGMNGQFEALYHGVPMISFPLYGDQHFNAGRAKDRRFGETMNIMLFEPQELVENINLVITNDSYSKSVMAASKAFKDRPVTPETQLVYLVDHVIKHGGDYLRARSLDIPWWQYLMLDILLIYSFALLIVFHVTIFLFCKLYCLLCARGNAKAKQL